MSSHTIESQFVQDQLARRVTPVNGKRIQPDGEYILYWMQARDRLEENWGLRYATLEADRLNRPLIIHHALGPFAQRACLVVTDDLLTAGVNARTARLADRIPCQMVRVESWCIVPAASFLHEEYAARTIRPKLAKVRDLCLEPVRDHPPKKRLSAAQLRSLELDGVAIDFTTLDITAEVARRSTIAWARGVSKGDHGCPTSVTHIPALRTHLGG